MPEPSIGADTGHKNSPIFKHGVDVAQGTRNVEDMFGRTAVVNQIETLFEVFVDRVAQVVDIFCTFNI